VIGNANRKGTDGISDFLKMELIDRFVDST
jgi:hypothetical protein